MSAFTSGADPALVARLRSLLDLVALQVLLDGCQTVLSGILQVAPSPSPSSERQDRLQRACLSASLLLRHNAVQGKRVDYSFDVILSHLVFLF